MPKTRSRFCRLNRRNKHKEKAALAAEIEAQSEESEAEMKFDDHAEEYDNFVPHNANNNHLENEAAEETKNALSFREAELNLPHVEEPTEENASHNEEAAAEKDNEAESENTETLNNLLHKMETEEVDLENIKNLSITLDKQENDLATLQSYVSTKLTELLKKSSLGEKCMESLAPLCTGNGTECGPLDKLLSLGSGCLSENNGLNPNELQVPEKEEYRDPPTLPSGIKFVDDFNKLLDGWADAPSSKANVFKLFNLSALLKHLGDPRYVEILNKLGMNRLTNNPHKKWDEILRDTHKGTQLVKHPLPELPNPKAVSNCTTRLVDLPRLDNKNVDEHAFKLYWAYTNTWLSKTFGPSFKNSALFQPTKNWYMDMERASQLFFLRLSKTLCSAQ